MANTFDIRFDRAAGLASIFDAPVNSFRWKGAGELSVDAEGIRVALKRSLVSLLVRQRSKRIPAQSITEVYREGEALRVEFATAENPRAVLPFWTRDRDTAAQIVQLLPTSRTIELEHSTNPPATSNARRNLVMAAVVALLAGGSLFIGLRRAPVAEAPAIAAAVKVDAAVIVPKAGTQSPPASAQGEPITAEEARKLAILAEKPVDWTPPPSVQRPRAERAVEATPPPAADEDGEPFVPMEVPALPIAGDDSVVRIPQTSLAYSSASELLNQFESGMRELLDSYRRERSSFDQGNLSAAQFADKLDLIELRWRNLTTNTLRARQFSDPALSGMRAALLSVVISQRVFLTGYADGLRTGDQARIDHAFEELQRSAAQLARAKKYLG